MSLVLSNQKKPNKTADITEYQREYREKNKEHLQNLGRVKYYKKKYQLEKDFTDLFGEYSGDVFKIIKDFNELKNKCPELTQHIISRLN